MTNKTTMLILTDPVANKNKFYEVTLSGNNVTTRYGRVGEDGKTFNKGSIGESGYLKTINDKKKKGYKEAQVLKSSRTADKTALSRAARTSFVKDGNPQLTKLVDKLVEINAHEIISASGGQLKVKDGAITTPLGLLTRGAINDARSIISKINSRNRKGLLGDYMTLVPQSFSRQDRSWVETFLNTAESRNQQIAFLTQLEQSLDFHDSNNVASNDDTALSDLFKYKIALETGSKVFNEIAKKFSSSRLRDHGSRLYNARIKNVYTFTNAEADTTFDAKAKLIGNVIEGWHGTRAMNLLSIASKGLRNPRQESGLVTTGAMFGRGIYSSTCSTKALGYSDTGVWGGSRGNTHYLFLVDLALGNTYIPGKTQPNSQQWESILDGKLKDTSGKPFNSIDAIPKYHNWLRNPETIVPDSTQMRIKYLLELES